MAEVLADQGRYEPGYKHPFAGQPGDTGAALREDEGQHSEQEHEVQDGSDSISDGNSNSTAPERFSADYDDFLLANINTKYKTNSDIKLFYMWAKENSEHRQIQDIPPAELDSLLARMYVGMYRCKKKMLAMIMFQTHAFRVYRPMDDPFTVSFCLEALIQLRQLTSLFQRSVRVQTQISCVTASHSNNVAEELSCADPEGRQGVRPPPPGKSQVIWISIEISIWTPTPWK